MNIKRMENCSTLKNMMNDPYEYQQMRGMAQGILWALDRSPQEAKHALYAAGQMKAFAKEEGRTEGDLPYLQGWISGLRKVLSSPAVFVNDLGKVMMEEEQDDRVYTN